MPSPRARSPRAACGGDSSAVGGVDEVSCCVESSALQAWLGRRLNVGEFVVWAGLREKRQLVCGGYSEGEPALQWCDGRRCAVMEAMGDADRAEACPEVSMGNCWSSHGSFVHHGATRVAFTPQLRKLARAGATTKRGQRCATSALAERWRVIDQHRLSILEVEGARARGSDWVTERRRVASRRGV